MALRIDVSSTCGTACATSCSCDSTATSRPCFLPFPCSSSIETMATSHHVLLDAWPRYAAWHCSRVDPSSPWYGKADLARRGNVRSHPQVCPYSAVSLWKIESDLVLSIKAIGNEHMPGAVSDHQGRSGLLGRCLRRHTAGPEDRCLIFCDRDGIAKVRGLQIAYA
jgi:hypothetical protein